MIYMCVCVQINNILPTDPTLLQQQQQDVITMELLELYLHVF